MDSAANRPSPLRAAIFLAGAALAAYLYIAYGSDSSTATEGRSIFTWLEIQWRYPDYKNNWVMLLVAAWCVFRERRALLEAEVRPSFLGTALVIASLLLHVIGFRSQLPRISLCSTVTTAWGLVWAVWGWNVAKKVAFPAAYCMLCFCSSLLVETTMPLRLAASRFACALLHGAGIQAVNQGTVVVSAAGGGFQFDVADACSGLRSLTVMTALAAPYAYFTMSTPFRSLLLFMSSVPLAMVANALRIFTIALVAENIGMTLAMQLYHDLSGYIVFFISIMLLIAAGRLIDRNWKETLCALKPQKRSRG